MIQSKTYIAVPPGETIREQLSTKGMSQEIFAEKMEMQPSYINRLLNGTLPITSDIASRLECILGIPKIFWERLEKIYVETIDKVNLEIDMQLIRKFPLMEMQKQNWVRKGSTKEENVKILREYFDTCSLSQMLNDRSLPIACRCLKKTEKTIPAVFAWAQKARIEARKVKVEKIDMQQLKDEIVHLRKLSLKKPNEFCPILSDTLAHCGIAIVFLSHLSGLYLHALSFYDEKKIVICLSTRGKDADKFWFSLFHEIGHILNGDLNKNGEITEEDEQKADDFARNTLIPDREFAEFCKQKSFTVDSIKTFAEKISVQPGIVVGRLQKDGYILFQKFNKIKEKYKIVNEE
ncbi:MAG: ImmA/IrrE family metallo-endopeptidase [Desulfovibrio sp.]|nr:ImmA/IrrE family metallo-endopeptidase [Desulfovibrio sp.]